MSSFGTVRLTRVDILACELESVHIAFTLHQFLNQDESAIKAAVAVQQLRSLARKFGEQPVVELAESECK